MFFDKFSYLCEQKGVSVARALIDMGMSKSSYKRWKTPNGLPSGDTIKKIADYFGVSVGYLLGDEEKPDTVEDDAELSEMLETMRNDEDVRALFKLAKGASKEDLRAAGAFLKTLRNPWGIDE